MIDSDVVGLLISGVVMVGMFSISMSFADEKSRYRKYWPICLTAAVWAFPAVHFAWIHWMRLCFRWFQ